MAEIDTEYLKTNEPFRKVRLIGGAYATVDTPSIVGFCHNPDHKGTLTVSIMNEHECIAKECFYFEKFEDYPYWQRYYRREELKVLEKAKKKRRKENQEKQAANVKKKEDEIISRAYKFAADLNIDNFKIISVHKNEEGYTIFYISDVPENDWYEFREIAFRMNRFFNKKFTLKHTKLPDGSYAVI